MKHSLHILDELTAVNSMLAHVEKENPYDVPDAYFNDFASLISAAVFIKSIGRINPYAIDEAYFSNFPVQVLQKIQDTTSVLPLKKELQQIFTLPEFYFDNLAGNILNKIKSAQQVKSEVQLELESISPFIAGINKTNVYKAPEGYFSSKVKVPFNDKKQVASKVIEMKPRRNWLAYAAAACVFFVLGLAGVKYFSKEQRTYTAQTAKPATSYAHLANINVQQAIDNLSDDEINSYLDYQNASAIYVTEPDDPYSLDVNRLIQNVPDNEIQEYLKDHNYDDNKSVSGI